MQMESIYVAMATMWTKFSNYHHGIWREPAKGSCGGVSIPWW